MSNHLFSEIKTSNAKVKKCKSTDDAVALLANELDDDLFNLVELWLLVCYKLYRYYILLSPQGIGYRRLGKEVARIESEKHPEACEALTARYAMDKNKVSHCVAVGNYVVERWIEETGSDDPEPLVHPWMQQKNYIHMSAVVEEWDARKEDPKCYAPLIDQCARLLKQGKDTLDFTKPRPISDLVGELCDRRAAIPELASTAPKKEKKQGVNVIAFVEKGNVLFDKGEITFTDAHGKVHKNGVLAPAKV